MLAGEQGQIVFPDSAVADRFRVPFGERVATGMQLFRDDDCRCSRAGMFVERPALFPLKIV
jgi:hypothetical protein